MHPVWRILRADIAPLSTLKASCSVQFVKGYPDDGCERSTNFFVRRLCRTSSNPDYRFVTARAAAGRIGDRGEWLPLGRGQPGGGAAAYRASAGGQRDL